MKKKMISFCAMILTMAQLFSIVSLPVAATTINGTGTNVMYGDVNDDAKVDSADVELLARYLSDDASATINLSAADTDGNGTVDLNDLMYLVKAEKGQADITLGQKITISFDTNGGAAIDPISLAMGGTVSMPEAEKENAVFLGWYKDETLQEPFYGSDPITEDITLYAKYQDLKPSTEYTPSAFALRDQKPDVSFDVERISGTLEPKDAVTVLATDGSASPVLAFAALGEGKWRVTAVGGYEAGASYQMLLADGYCFVGKNESIREASFYIFKEEVVNFTTNSDIIYIRDTESMTYALSDGTVNDVLSSAVLYNSDDVITGTFSYAGEAEFAVGDTLCIYVTEHPNERDYINADYTNDPASYIVVEAINGSEINFRGMSMQGENSDVEKLISLPSTIPFSMVNPPEGDGTIDYAAHDTAALYSMYGTSAPTEVKTGDFLVFYSGSFGSIREGDKIIYKRVTAVNEGKISYIASTQQELVDSINLFLADEVDGGAMLESVDQEALENQVMQQVAETGFAEDAVQYLAKVITNSEEFYEYIAENKIAVYDENGLRMTEDQMRAYGLGHSFELSDDVKLGFNVTKCDGENSHFKDGMKVALTIGAEFEVDVGKGGKMGSIKIELSAAFTQEVMIDVSIKANADITWVLFVPVIHDIVFSSAVDAMSYTGISVEAKMYTQEPSEDFFDKVVENWGDKLGKANLEKIENFKKKYEGKFGEGALGDDIEGFWEEQTELIEEIAKSGDLEEDALKSCMESTNELEIMQTFFNNTGLMNDEEYGAGITELAERYADMLNEEDNGWLELCKAKIFEIPINLYLFQISIEGNFVVRANVNIALGANLEYEIGKRYINWFSIFGNGSGSSEIDLIDERFAFQFYAMGHIGLRVGILLEVKAGIISTKIGYVGIAAEFGAYADLYGYFEYTYTKYRPANGKDWEKEESIIGAIYFEFGLYLDIRVTAALLSVLEKEWDLYNGQWALLSAGNKNNVYGFATELEDGEKYVVADGDGNSNNGILCYLAENFRSMNALDMTSGKKDTPIKPWIAYYDYSFWDGDDFSLTDNKEDKTNFHYSLSSKYFSLVPVYEEKNGKQYLKDYKVEVEVPEGVHYLTCDLRLVWCLDKLCWSKYDIDLTIPLVWTDLSDEELKEFRTATVKVGNEADGYRTVWTERFMKGENFDLPGVQKVLNYVGYAGEADVQYSGYKGYTVTNRGDAITSQEQSMTFDTIYYFEMDLRDYTITINDVQKSDGTVTNMQFTAKFGEAFDFSSLAKTGKNLPGDYTIFSGIEARNAKGEVTLRDATELIKGNFANELLEKNITYHAKYKNNSGTVTYKFTGIMLDPIEKVYKNGGMPSQGDFVDAINRVDETAYVSSITPAFMETQGDIIYTVTVTIPEKPLESYTITFESNGGSQVAPSNNVERSTITPPQNPTREGYSFAGWFYDKACTEAMDWTRPMPAADMTLYAKWTASTYKIKFDAGEGSVAVASKEVVYDEKIGELPAATRDNYTFLGWYDAASGGTAYTADSVYKTAGDLTLYARWEVKGAIPTEAVSFANETLTYDGKEHRPELTCTMSDVDESSFVVSYKRQILDRNWTTELPVNAGTYDIRVQRAADDNYQAFEYVYTGKLVIEKKERTIQVDGLDAEVYFANLMAISIPEYEGDGTPMYAVERYSNSKWNRSDWQTSAGFMNLSAGKYRICFYIAEGENYQDSNAVVLETEYDVAATGNSDFKSVSYKLSTRTSGKAWAETTNAVYARFKYVDGSQGSRVRVSNTRWLGDTGVDTLPSPTDPWMIKSVTYTLDGSNAWKCRTVMLDVTVDGVEIQYYGKDDSDGLFELEDSSSKSIDMNNLFGRNITSVGDFDTAVELTLGEADGPYTYIYDGTVVDQYASWTIDGTSYNCYAHTHAPVLTFACATPVVNGHNYAQYFSSSIRTVTIDRDELYKAMLRDGISSIQATATLTFDEGSTLSGNVWTKEFTIDLPSAAAVSEDMPEYATGTNGSAAATAAEDNEYVYVTIGLENNPGVWGVKNIVTYNTDELRLVHKEQGTLASAYEILNSEAKGKITVLAYRDDVRESYQSGSFITLTFQKLAATVNATDAVKLETVKIINDKGQTPHVKSSFSIGDLTNAPSVDDNTYTKDADELVKALKQHLENRSTEVLTLHYADNKLITETEISEWFHDAKNELGSYAQFGIKSYSANMQKYLKEDVYYYTLTYRIEYYTTDAQEQEFETKLQDVVKGLDVAGKTDFEKVQTAYEYVCENVAYDEKAANSFTAYGALMDGKAVCQGYALLLMRMLQSMDINADVVFGEAKSVNHMWNIVNLDGEYFLLDATWDSQSTTGCYLWFLKGSANFEDHEADGGYKVTVSTDDHDGALAASHVLKSDNDKTHFCARCQSKVSDCIDGDGDSKCDVCGAGVGAIRVYGPDRTATARDIADELKMLYGIDEFETMVYVNGDIFADALTGTYLANMENAPILLYRASSAAENLEYIKKNLAEGGFVYILGGINAIPASVESALKNAGIQVIRLSGKTRFETNLEILEKAGFVGGETVLVCTGFEYADSLSASATGMPILLVDNGAGELRDAQVEYLKGLDAKCEFVVIGGTAAISADLVDELEVYDANGEIERLSGKTRYETSILLAETYFEAADRIVLAYGREFADGLCGGPLAYEIGAPIVLAEDGKADVVAAYTKKGEITSGYVLGGTARLTDVTVRTAYNMAKDDVIAVK